MVTVFQDGISDSQVKYAQMQYNSQEEDSILSGVMVRAQIVSVPKHFIDNDPCGRDLSKAQSRHLKQGSDIGSKAVAWYYIFHCAVLGSRRVRKYRRAWNY